MAAFNMKLTESGREILAKTLSGKLLRFANILLGDGGDLSSEKMISTRKTIPVTSVRTLEGKATVKATLSVDQLEENFIWREIGVTVLDPDTDVEMLYAYGNCGEDGDQISVSGTLTEKQISVVLFVEENTQVTTTVDESLIFTEKAEFDAFAKAAWVVFSCQKAGTIFALSGDHQSGLVHCIFLTPAAYTAGDTFTVNGETYTLQLQNGEEAKDNLFVAGTVVSCIIDTENKTVNFKASGGSIKYATGRFNRPVAALWTVSGLDFKPVVVLAYALPYQKYGAPSFIGLKPDGTMAIQFQGSEVNDSLSYFRPSDKNVITEDGFSIALTTQFGYDYSMGWDAWGL